MRKKMKKYDKILQKKIKNAYTIDHTTISYLMDDQNNYVNYLALNLKENDLAASIVDNILKN